METWRERERESKNKAVEMGREGMRGLEGGVEDQDLGFMSQSGTG